MKSFIAFACAVVASGACLANTEPVLDWSVVAFDAQGNQTRIFRQGSHAGTQQQLRTLCDPYFASRFDFPPTVNMKVEVRPPALGGPQSTRILKTAEFSCTEVRSDNNSLVKKISVPQKPKPKTDQNVIQLWK